MAEDKEIVYTGVLSTRRFGLFETKHDASVSAAQFLVAYKKKPAKHVVKIDLHEPLTLDWIKEKKKINIKQGKEGAALFAPSDEEFERWREAFAVIHGKNRVSTLEGNMKDLHLNPLDLDFRMAKELGRGGKGVVRTATMKNVGKVAVKELHGARGSADEEQLLSEVSLLQALRHPRIINVIGFCRSPTTDNLLVVMEYVDGGDLQKYVLDPEHYQLPFTLLCKLALGIAEAMAFVHDHNVMHRDLKPGNILVANWDRGDIRVTDFGFSRRAPTDSVTLTTTGGTPIYTAPEVNQGRYGLSADVYSFGLILVEFLTRHLAWHESLDYNNPQLSLSIVAVKAANGERPLFPSTAPWLSALIKGCWDHDPAARPPFSRVCEIIRNNAGSGSSSTDLAASSAASPSDAPK